MDGVKDTLAMEIKRLLRKTMLHLLSQAHQFMWRKNNEINPNFI